MSHFAEILRSFRSGALSADQLLSEVDGELQDRHTAPATLLAILDREHAERKLPAEVYVATTRRVSQWLQDHTVTRVEPAIGSSAGRLPAETSNTERLSKPGETETSAPIPAPQLPHLLQGRFKLIQLIGEGGMSRVYKALDLRRLEARSEDPYLAVKVLTAAFDDRFGSLAALHREAYKLQSLTHPNIVRVIDCDRDGQAVFMTMELLCGQSLQGTIAAPGFDGLPQGKAVPLIAAIAEALEFAHRKSIVHGDLKPGNVIITDQGETKVIDFGIARFVAKPKEPGGERHGAWESLHALTPPYASPEMLEDREPDPRDDVYALSCIAYEVLTGTHPFGRQSAVAARNAGLKLERRRGMTSRQFRAIAGGLQFDRGKRTASARRFMDEFERRLPQVRWPVLLAAAVAALIIAVVLDRSRDRSAPAEVSAPATPATGTVFRDCPTCPLMTVLPAGSFVQGSAAASFEQPQHTVSIGYPFAAAVNEVTIGEFSEFVDDTGFSAEGCHAYDGEWTRRPDIGWNAPDPAQTNLHPVSCVSWNDAVAYTDWLSEKTGETYRLPSASEWEYAARGGGDAAGERSQGPDLCTRANVADRTAAARYPGWDVFDCDDRHVQSAPVGTFAANSFGLRDTLGNLFEWVADCWVEDYRAAPSDGSAHSEGACGEREMRGGSWFTPPEHLRATYRNRFPSDYRGTSIGFRVVRELP